MMIKLMRVSTRSRALPVRTPEILGTYGFTLIELLVTIAVMAVLLGIAVPSFNNAVLAGKLNSYANNLVSSALLARSEAIKRNATTILCVSTDGTTCASGGWEQGWIVLAGATVIQKQQAITSGMKITESGGTSSISFKPTGIGATPAAFTVCRVSPSIGSQERVVHISSTGRPRVTVTTAGACS